MIDRPLLDPASLSAGALIWAWRHPTQGSLATVFAPDGTVSEWRRHIRDDRPSQCPVGSIGTNELDALSVAAAALMSATPMDSVTDGESLYVGRVNNHGALEMRVVDAATVDRGVLPAWTALRAQALALRNRAEGGRFRWRSLAGRLFWISLLVGLYVLYLWFQGNREAAQIEREGWRATATVVERVGRSGMDEHKFLLVRFADRAGASATSQISEYLSAPHWEAATPGSEVQVLQLQGRGTYLVEDIERYQHQKQWFLGFPLLLIGMALGALRLLPRYRIGTHADGQEYIVDGDRVVSDDKDTPVSRLNINLARMLWRVLK
mgnify:FL=1